MFTVSFEECLKSKWIPAFIRFNFLNKPVNCFFETVDEILLFLEKVDFDRVPTGIYINFDKLAVNNMMIIPVGGMDNAFAFFYTDEYFSADKIGDLQDVKEAIKGIEQVFLKPKLKEKYVKKSNGYEILSRQYFKKNDFNIRDYD